MERAWKSVLKRLKAWKSEERIDCSLRQTEQRSKANFYFTVHSSPPILGAVSTPFIEFMIWPIFYHTFFTHVVHISQNYANKCAKNN